MDFLSNVLVIFLAFLTAVLWRKNSRYIQLLEKLPCPKRVIFFGNVLPFMTKPEARPEKFLRTMEPFHLQGCPVVCLWTFHLPYVFITRSSAAEVVLSSTTNITKSRTYDLLKPWLGLGLLTSTGDKWHSHRKLLTPSFHFRILENFMPILNEQSEILISKLMEKEGKGKFDIYPYITLCTLDIICDTAMGKRIDAQFNKNTDYVKALNLVTSIIMERTVKVWLLIPWIFKLSSYGRLQEKSLKILHKFTNDVIQERKKEREESKHTAQPMKDQSKDNGEENIYGRKQRLAFLDTLLEASEKGNMLTDEEIREEVDTFMFEGHDTTSAGITWALFCLGWCPTVQKMVHQELDDVFGTRWVGSPFLQSPLLSWLTKCDSCRPVGFDDLPKLKYLEATIKETFRLVPPVPLYARCLCEDIDIGEYKIPAGTEVVITPSMIQNDPKLYTDPLRFNPARFLAEDWQKRNPYGFVPFSAGPRNCIGQKFAMMEEKVVLSHILRKFEVKVYDSFTSVKSVAHLVFRPINGMYVALEMRKHHKKLN